MVTTSSDSNHILLCNGVTHLLGILIITGLNSKVRMWSNNINGLSSSLHQLIYHVSLYCVKYYLHLWMCLIFLSLVYVYYLYGVNSPYVVLLLCSIPLLLYLQWNNIKSNQCPSFCFKYHLYLFMSLISCHYYMCIMCM